MRTVWWEDAPLIRMICLYTHVHLCAEKIAICVYHTPFMYYILQDTNSILDF